MYACNLLFIDGVGLYTCLVMFLMSSISDYIQLREATVIIQTSYRAFRHRIIFLRKRKAAILLQVAYVFV